MGESEVGVMGALKGGADALDEFRSWQQPSRLNHSALAVHPFGLDGIQPGTLDRQKARDDAHAGARQLPPGPPDVDETTSSIEPTPADGGGHPAVTSISPELPAPGPQASPQDLASLIAQLAGVTSSLEAAAREDARAREQGSIELARYETLAAERHETERALAEAREVRTAAELLSSQAFTEDARAQAARHAAVARAAELACAELLAERTRAADELASRPHLARVIADRRRREQERAQVARQAEEARAARLADGIAAARQMLTAGPRRRSTAAPGSSGARFSQQ